MSGDGGPSVDTFGLGESIALVLLGLGLILEHARVSSMDHLDL